MKILHLMPPDLGGIGSYIFNHYRYMDQDSFQFDFITRDPNLQDAVQYRDFRYGVKLLTTTAAKNKDLFVQTVQSVLKDGYDVLHLHNSYWTGTLMEEIAKDVGIKKVIVHSHSTYIDVMDEEKRECLIQQHEAIKKAIPEDLATDYWACSRMAADWLFGSRIPRDRIQIMKNAIDLEKYRFNPQRRNGIRAELGLGDATVFGAIGRLSYPKNHGFLVDVFAEFHQKHPNCKLIIVGDGELKDELERQIQEKRLKDSVLLPGWRTNVEDYLQAMDVFLLPSRFEGFPISILEAAASGLPCVVSENVTDEIELSSNIQRRPLVSASWISAMEEMTERTIDRQNGVKILQAAGYDVRQQAKVLERMYEA